MISRYEAYMDGIALSSVDPAVFVLDIQHGEIRPTIMTNKIAGRVGMRVVKNEIESASASVVFEIHEYDPVKRQAICQKVQKWADGTYLTISERPGQRLKCVCTQYPSSKARKWTESLSVTFTAYNLPYWEDITPTTVTRTAAQDTAYVPGNAPEALVSATITANASLSSLTVTAGGKTITLSSLGAAQNDKIYIGYDENNILYIKKGSTSVLNKRTGDDELTVKCGKHNNFGVSANCTAVFTVRGCWY